MRRFKYYQPNSKDLKDNIGDCSIRAFTKALGKSWQEVFDILVPYAREQQCLLNQKPCYEKALLDLGWQYVPCKRGTKLTVHDMATKFRTGICICYVRAGYGTHLVTVKDGNYFDTWDSGQKLLFGYWIKK